MPDQLALAYETRRPLLTHAADALRVEIDEAIHDANVQVRLGFRSLTADEFLERAQNLLATDTNPLIDIPDQIVGRAEFETLDALNHAAAALKEFLTEVSRSWTEFSPDRLPELQLSCLIPPQAKPEGWSDRDDVPSIFELQLCIAPKKTPAPVPRLREAPDHFALVMKGGGIKGLAYVGAIAILSQHYSFNWFIGTSAGAITAVLLAAGYSPADLLDILQRKNFRDFFDAPWYKLPLNLLIHKGFHTGNAFTNWLDTLLAQKLKSHARVRLSDLAPNRVTVYASRREKRVLTFDSVDHDADAAYAVRCSMSIPFIFMPQSDQGIRTYDGGLQHNFPVDELLLVHPGTPFVSLFLGNEVYEPVKQGFILSDLLSIWTESNDSELIAQYRDQTLVIDPRPIGTLDFDLTPTEKAYLIAAGQAAALAHIDKSSDACAVALQIRDELKVQVEAARNDRRKRRRRRFWRACAVILVAAIFFWVWRVLM